LINRDKPPFNNPELRRAMALAIDRQAFIDIITQGKGDIGGVLQPPPAGLWGMPPEQLAKLPGYDTDVNKPYIKELTMMVNDIYSGWRMEDVWLDK
jgi:peptide/nickel transport system substrate-binding protein